MTHRRRTKRRWRLAGLRERLRPAREEERSYKSPDEIALQNAAETLGVALGEYYLDDGDIVESSGDREAAARLDAAREELLVHIERLASPPPRQLSRRWLYAAVVAIVGVFAAGVVLAPSQGSDSFDEDDPEAVAGLFERFRKSGPARGAVAIGGPSVSTKLTWGREVIIATAFVNPYGEVCSGTVHESPDGRRGAGVGGCKPPSWITKSLVNVRARASGVGGGRGYTSIQGFAHTDLQAIVVRGTDLNVQVAISPPWTMSADEPPVKAFIVLIPIPAPIHPSRIDSRAIAFMYEFLAVFEDRIRPLGGFVTDAYDAPDRRRLYDPITDVSGRQSSDYEVRSDG